MMIAKYYDASQFGKPSVPQGAHDLIYGIQKINAVIKSLLNNWKILIVLLKI